MALREQLDRVAPVRFPDMTMVNARDALREIQAAPNETVITKEVEGLSDAQRDTLMKVVYVGLANDYKNSSVYFKWHAALFAAAGPGSIVRVMTDKAPKLPPEA